MNLQTQSITYYNANATDNATLFPAIRHICIHIFSKHSTILMYLSLPNIKKYAKNSQLNCDFVSVVNKWMPTACGP